MAWQSYVVHPKPGITSASFRQKLSWEIREEDWNNAIPGDVLILLLKENIPIAEKTPQYNYPTAGPWPYPGGHIELAEDMITFFTEWPTGYNLDDINIQTEFKLRTNDALFAVDLKGGWYDECFPMKNKCISVSINPELLFDESRSFVIEAEILVEVLPPNASGVGRANDFVNDVKSIFSDEKNSDVVVIAEDQTFKCHKIILSARSDVFKNTLASNTLESESNTIVMKEAPSMAVEDMLKYLYSGDTPEDPGRLSLDLLHLAEMYQLQPLKQACVKNLIEGLDVVSCISTLILVDRYMPNDGDVREKVTTFIECKAKEVVELEDWGQLVKTQPSLVTELTRTLVRGDGNHRCQWCVLKYDE